MGVLLQGEGRVLVAKALSDDLDRYARLEGDRCVSVSEIVKPDSWQGCLGHQTLECL